MQVILSKLVGFESVQHIGKNQIVIRFKNGRLFQSYDSIIAVQLYQGGKKLTFLSKKWNYSVTTGKYRNQFLNEKKKETESKIRSGEYQLI